MSSLRRPPGRLLWLAALVIVVAASRASCVAREADHEPPSTLRLEPVVAALCGIPVEFISEGRIASDSQNDGMILTARLNLTPRSVAALILRQFPDVRNGKDRDGVRRSGAGKPDSVTRSVVERTKQIELAMGPDGADGRLMDEVFGRGWRLVLDAQLPAPATTGGLTVIDLALAPERDGVVAAWMQRHGCHAALLRPDHHVYGTATTPDELEALLAERQAALTT